MNQRVEFHFSQQTLRLLCAQLCAQCGKAETNSILGLLSLKICLDRWAEASTSLASPCAIAVVVRKKQEEGMIPCGEHLRERVSLKWGDGSLDKELAVQA